jgi:hypothetical protein
VLQRPARNSWSAFETATGPVIYPGGLWTAFLVSPALQAAHGRSPWWLRWFRGAPTAREALRDHGLVELSDGCAVPVPLRPGGMRERVIEETLAWIAEVAPLLEKARSERLAGEPASNSDSRDDAFAALTEAGAEIAEAQGDEPAP